MSLIQVSKLYKSFAGEVIFKEVSFSVNEKDKIGVIGLNGTGKSTLIKILMGLEDHDINPQTSREGLLAKKSSLRIGYLSQHSNLNEEHTPFEELMALYNLKHEYNKLQEADESEEAFCHAISEFERKDGYTIEHNIQQTLSGLEVASRLWHSKISSLSGGQRSRVSLAKILLQEPELLILDEPTNHLDINAIQWLEAFLQNYKKAFILISHDTYFLDNTVTSILEIEAKKIKEYTGNYTAYAIQKEIYLSGALRAFTKEQEKAEKLREFVLKYKAGNKSKQATGRQKLLERMEMSDNPIIPIRKMKLKFNTDVVSSSVVLDIQDLAKSFGESIIFENINLKLNRGDRVGLIGKNGVGKSTILKIINGLQKASSGVLNFGQKLNIGYYDQDHENLNLKNTILEEIITNFDVAEERARNIAGSFLFTQDDTLKVMQSLSGGERARVSLMKLILSKPNFLIMDEPTNHLDIYSREILEEALEGYLGTMLLVSHDRTFLDNVVNKIYVLNENSLKTFDGNYTNYIRQKSFLDKGISQKNTLWKNVLKKDVKTLSYAEQKKIRNRISILKKQVQTLEAKIRNAKEEEDILYQKASEITDETNLAEIQNKIDSNYFVVWQEQNKIMILQQEIAALEKERNI